MNDDSVSRVRWVGVSVTCYLLLGAHVLWLFGRRRVNCRVVWGLDRWAVRVVGFGCWFLWWLFWLEIGVNHVISRDFRLVCWWIVIWLKWWFESGVWGLVSCGVVGLWRMMDLALVIGECDDVIQASRWLCDRRSLGRCETWRSRRGVTEVTERLMMLDVELVVNLYRSSRAFSRNCCVFGIIVRFADWLIDFYLKWCGVWWWCRLFWIGNLNNVRGGCRSR